MSSDFKKGPPPGLPGESETEQNFDPANVEKLRELMDRAGPLIEQLNNLYNQYACGVDKIPPLQRREQLDQMMNMIMLMAKPTRALRFKYNTIYGRYITYRERWEKTLKDLESGKLQRNRR